MTLLTFSTHHSCYLSTLLRCPRLMCFLRWKYLMSKEKKHMQSDIRMQDFWNGCSQYKEMLGAKICQTRLRIMHPLSFLEIYNEHDPIKGFKYFCCSVTCSLDPPNAAFCTVWNQLFRVPSACLPSTGIWVGSSELAMTLPWTVASPWPPCLHSGCPQLCHSIHDCWPPLVTEHLTFKYRCTLSV